MTRKINAILVSCFDAICDLITSKEKNQIALHLLEMDPHKSHIHILAKCLDAPNSDASLHFINQLMKRCLSSDDMSFDKTVLKQLESTEVSFFVSEETLICLAESGTNSKWDIVCLLAEQNFGYAIRMISWLDKTVTVQKQSNFLNAVKKYCFSLYPIQWRQGGSSKIRKDVTKICKSISVFYQDAYRSQLLGLETGPVLHQSVFEILNFVRGDLIFDSVFKGNKDILSGPCANPLISLSILHQTFMHMKYLTASRHLPNICIITIWVLKNYFTAYKKIDAGEEPEKHCNYILHEVVEHLNSEPSIISSLDPKLLKSVVNCILKYRYTSKGALILLNCLAKQAIELDPSAIQIMMMITTHSLFETTMTQTLTDENTVIPPHPAKSSLLRLMQSVIERDVVACCTLETLMKIAPNYHGTTNESDFCALDIFRVYEEKAGVSVFSNITNWGTGDMDARLFQPADIFNSINHVRMAASIHWFPLWRDIQNTLRVGFESSVYSTKMKPIYDPAFILPLLACSMKNYREKIDVRVLIESQALGMAIMGFSSLCLFTRQAAHFVLSEAFAFIDESEFKERNQIMLFLTCFRNGIPIEKRNEISPLPSLITSFAAQSLMILLKPESDMYAMINQFCLQRPVLDINDVPMFYNLFYSHSDSFRKERIWILQLLLNGLNTFADYKLYQRRHVLDILMVFFSSPFADKQMRKLIFEILFKAACIPQLVIALVLKSGLTIFLKTCCSNLTVKSDLGSALPILCRKVFQSICTENLTPAILGWIQVQFFEIAGILIKTFGTRESISANQAFVSHVIGFIADVLETSPSVHLVSDSKMELLLMTCGRYHDSEKSKCVIKNNTEANENQGSNFDIDCLFLHNSDSDTALAERRWNLFRIITNGVFETDILKILVKWTLDFVEENENALEIWVRWILKLSVSQTNVISLHSDAESYGGMVKKLSTLLNSSNDYIAQLSRAILVLELKRESGSSKKRRVDGEVKGMVYAGIEKYLIFTATPQYLLDSGSKRIVDCISCKMLGIEINAAIRNLFKNETSGFSFVLQ